MNIPDETLMAYVDDELDAVARAKVDAALAADPQLADRLARQRTLTGQLRAAFDGVLEEPLPPRLLAAARATGDIGNADRQGVADRWLRSGAMPTRHGSWPQWGALAASLIVGVLAGYALPRHAPGGLVPENGRLIARGALASTLSKQLASSAPDEAAPLRVGLSFLAGTGDYCRTFTLAGTGEQQPLAGLACKDGPDWHIRVLAQAQAPAHGDYRMATSAMPQAVLRAVDDSIAGDPLDASAERAARDSGWRR